MSGITPKKKKKAITSSVAYFGLSHETVNVKKKGKEAKVGPGDNKKVRNADIRVS